MTDKGAILTAVAVSTAVLLTVMVALHGRTTQQLQTVQTSIASSFEVLNRTIGARIEDVTRRPDGP